MYITHDEYRENGGIVEDTAAFRILEKKARYKLDYCTQGRIGKLADIPESVRDCMTYVIDMLHMQGSGGKVSSFSNDGVSVSFEKMDESHEIYKVIMETLPPELIYWGAN